MKHFIGIDWGTHSSKWCYQDERGTIIVGPIWDSRVWREEDVLMMATAQMGIQDIGAEEALKRKLIHDPYQPFWDGERPKLGATLAEAVTFSLLVLLSDVKRHLLERNIDISNENDIVLRLSNPNWITPESLPALQHFRDCGVIAVQALLQGTVVTCSNGTAALSITDVRRILQTRRDVLSSLSAFSLPYDFDAYNKCSKGQIQSVSWELVFESSAAGFSYLVDNEPEAFEDDRPAESVRWVRKILVVDIGAGSTDAGYMLRTLPPGNSKPLLLCLPAFAALERAGGWLTDKIMADWLQGGRPATRMEAEEYKTSGKTDWYSKPYLAEWCESIANHIGSYVSAIPDTIRLPRAPGLEVVITGGSSGVQPIREYLIKAITDALRERKVGVNVIEGTQVLKLSSNGNLGRSYKEIQLAQLAVAVGASNPRLVEFKHYANLH